MGSMALVCRSPVCVCMEICNKCGVSEAKRYLSDTKLEKSAQDSRLLAGGGGTLNF